MAGESPDRSKQRESSAEATSGSTGPVPEARGERARTPGADAARDPRIAVARTSDGARGGANSANSRGAEESPVRGGVDTATHVLSLRDAEPAEPAEPAEARASSAEPAEPADAAESAGRKTEAGTGEGPDGQDAVSRAPERAPEADRKAEAPGGAQEGARAASAAHSDSEDAPEGADADADADDGEDAPEGADADDGDTADDDEPEADAQKADADADEADAPTDAEPSDAEPADAEPADVGPSDATDVASTSVPDTDVESPADADTDAAAPAPAPAGVDEGESEGEDGGEAADVAAEPADHPTTVFKAVRPDKPRVDQPTTMLKLPGGTKPGRTTEPGKGADAGKAAEPGKAVEESPAERTSKFVALKPLDDRATRGFRPVPDRPVPDEAAAPAPRVGADPTTQQPLPPKPPLDLLAELTNTPPPPDTAVRTTLRRIKIWTPLVLLLIVAFAVAQAVRPLPAPGLTLTADDTYTFDGSSADLSWPSEGQGWMDVEGVGTMGDVGKQTPVAIGSVAKAMTAYIVLKDHPLAVGKEGASITVDATAQKEGGYDKDGESTLNTVKAGDKLTEKQALSAIMIPSANNIARLLARWDAGSEAAFVKKMNATAKKLGMTNTTYTDPSGLKETTLSTSRDQVRLGNELVKIPALMAITKLPSWTDPSGHEWRNYNTLVPYDGALGIKTGTTTAAGGNLLFAATKEVGGETVTVVGAILGQHTAPIIDTVNAVSKTAVSSAQTALTSAKILKKGQVVGYVDDELGGRTPVVVTKDVAAVGWAGLKVKLSFEADDVPHTAKAGTKVGTLTVGDGTDGAVKVPVALQDDLTEPGFSNKLTRIT